MGIHDCTPFKNLHAIHHGLIKYEVEVFHDIIREKAAGKVEKALYNQYFWTISRYMARQSERDFPPSSAMRCVRLSTH